MLVQYLSVFGIMILLIGFFAFALNFSKYKRRSTPSGCCGGGHCDTETDESHSCGCYEEKMQFVENYDSKHNRDDHSCACGH